MAEYFDEEDKQNQTAVQEPADDEPEPTEDNTSPEATDVREVGEAAPRGAAAPRVYQGGREYDPNTGTPLGGQGGKSDYDVQVQNQMRQAFAQLPPEMQQQYWLNQIKLTQADQMQQQKYENGISYVRQQLAAHNIDEKTASEQIEALQNHVSPLQLRAMKAAVLQKQIATQAAQEELSTIQRNKQQVMEEDAQNSEKGITASEVPAHPGMHTYTQIDPKTGLRHAVPGMPGSKEYVAERTRQDARDQAEKERTTKNELAHVTKDEQAYDSAFETHAKNVKADILDFEAAKDKKAAPSTSINLAWRKSQGEENPGLNETQKRVAEQLGMPPGSKGTREEYLQFQAAKRARARGTLSGDTGTPTPSAGQTPAVQSSDRTAIESKLTSEGQATKAAELATNRQRAQQTANQTALFHAHKFATTFGDQNATAAINRLVDLNKALAGRRPTPGEQQQITADYALAQKYLKMAQ